MSMPVTGRIAFAGALVLVSTYLAPAGSAFAEEASNVDSTAAAVAAADPTLVDESIDLSNLPTEGQQAVGTDDVEITMSEDATDGMILTAEDAIDLQVDLPFADEAAKAEISTHGLAVFDNANGSKTVPVPRQDGSVQINTVIVSADAPTEYTYTFTFSAHENPEIRNVDGVVLFLDDEEKLLAGMAPAWAKDANGNAVNTRYEVSDNTVTQIIEHGEGSAYPIVADPWLGIKLWSRITVDSYRSQPRVNLDLSGWGWAVWSGVAQGGGVAGFAAGQAILNNAGWSEAQGWSTTVRNALDKTSQRQQFECHALGALFAGQWNLEKFRPNRTTHWSFGVAVHHCNWTTANRY